MDNLKISMTQIDKNIIHIYDTIHGYAFKRFCHNSYSYMISISFIKNKCLYKIQTNEKDETVRNLYDIEKRILKMYNEE